MEITNNKQQFRFEYKLPDGEFITLDYRWLKGSMVLMHTLVPVSARGTGLGNAFLEQVLHHVRTLGLRIIVYCSFATAYIASHPQYLDLLDPAHGQNK
jgi:uncharacterized protein